MLHAEGLDKVSLYRGTSLIRNTPTSLIRNTPLLGPYSRTMPRALWWSLEGGLFILSEVTSRPPWTCSTPRASTRSLHPGVELRANRKSISHRCHLFEVAFVWELTKETIYLPLGCIQGGWGCVARRGARHGLTGDTPPGQLTRCQGLSPQGQNLAVTVLCVPGLPDNG